MIEYKDMNATVDGSHRELVVGVERIIEEIAYTEMRPPWEIWKDITVEIISRERYKALEDDF